MKVLKFGGTSLRDAEHFRAVASIALSQFKMGFPVAMVLSAPSTVTNQLVGLTQLAMCQKTTQEEQLQLRYFFKDLIQQLETDITDNIHSVSEKFNADTVWPDIENILTDLAQWLQGVMLLGQCPNTVYAQVISSGERLSVVVMRALLLSFTASVRLLEPGEFFMAEGDAMEAEINLEKSIRKFKNKIETDSIYLMPGFVAKNQKNEVVLLGRNGSDYSATALAVLLNANACEIWTDVDGIYNCDPRLVADANLLQTLSYQEAMELSYFGAKILHPKTISPLIKYKIPCRIKNTEKPEAKGTLISKTSAIRKEKIKAISSLTDISMINITGSGLKGKVGMAGRLFSCLSRAGISIILITQSSSEYSISLSIHTRDKAFAKETLQDEFQLELERQLLEPLEFIDELAIISLIGDGMHQTKGVSGRFMSALADASINIIAIAQGSSERSISVVIREQQSEAAIKKCHQQFFDATQYINLFLLGCGGVGAELLSQIKRQKEVLQKNNLGVRVCGIANSEKIAIDPEGINLKIWQKQLQSSEDKFSLLLIEQQVLNHQLMNPVIVDCSSNDSLAESYVDYLKAGFHVVAANKKANTKSCEYYEKLREMALKNRRKFLYDTNVGAGLPVIETLKNLILAGDELKKFNGILSGSLSFIFGELDKGSSFSQITLQALDKGFTEPDPRDDLSGMDVARKLLILARESGLKLELEEIEIQSALPESFHTQGNIEDFLSRLPEVDSYYEKKIQQATKQNKVLRYVGSIEAGKCKVSVEAVDESDPLYKVTAGENALAFYSRYYHPVPLVLRGYGAGAEVTAAGVYSDIMKILK